MKRNFLALCSGGNLPKNRGWKSEFILFYTAERSWSFDRTKAIVMDDILIKKEFENVTRDMAINCEWRKLLTQLDAGELNE